MAREFTGEADALVAELGVAISKPKRLSRLPRAKNTSLQDLKKSSGLFKQGP